MGVDVDKHFQCTSILICTQNHAAEAVSRDNSCYRLVSLVSNDFGVGSYKIGQFITLGELIYVMLSNGNQSFALCD